MCARTAGFLQGGHAATELHKRGVAAQEEMQAQVDAAKAKHESEMVSLLDELRELQREVKNHHAKLFAGLDSKATAL